MVPLALVFMGAGRLLRARNATVDALQVRTAELRAQREQNAKLAVEADRARIGGDLDTFLHDRVGEIATTAATGRATLESDPDQAQEAGASGFLLKDAPSEQLVAAVRSVAAGDALIDPSITRRLIERFVQASRPGSIDPPQIKDLTPRERDVLRQVAQGLSNAEIAARLFFEENTVKTHVGRILMKLHLRDRVQAVVFAYDCGFVDRSGS